MLGDDIRHRRERLGWKQEDLAERADLNKNTVTRLEKNRGVRLENIQRVDRALQDGERERGFPVGDLSASLAARPTPLAPRVDRMTLEELDLLKFWRAIPTRQREGFLIVIREAAQRALARTGESE